MQKRYAVVFPGQGSQKPGMGREAFDSSSAARDVFEEVSKTLGRDLAELCFRADDETLRRTDNAQIALYAVSVSTYRAMEDHEPPIATAGHSVGEYAALACASVFSVAEGARLVQRRGELMAEAGSRRPGTMAAILGLDDEAIEATCAEVSMESGIVVVANYNSPRQTVISGDVNAVLAAMERLREGGAKRCIQLNVSGAFHSPLMEDAAQKMEEALREASFEPPQIPVVSNVTANVEVHWAGLLEQQLRSPVRWTQSVRRMRDLGVETFVECGPGEVLSGLIRRIDSEAVTVSAKDFCGQ
ncbi:MAG: ACP S-malonyltransferase [Armatimonadetes bacterium]|nr:ACP S-malonyltransferase [Armatimonadota bacterium]